MFKWGKKCSSYITLQKIFFIILFALLFAFSFFTAEAANLSVGNYILINQVRVGRTTYDYTYKADVTKSNTDSLTNVVGSVSSGVPSVIVIDSDLTFGDVGPGETVTSVDTFSIRVDLSYPFDENNLSWIFIFNNIPVTLSLINVTPKSTTFTSIGETQQLSVTGTYSNGSTADLTSAASGTTYASSDTTVATVSAEGLVTAVADGTATITATNIGISDTASVTVSTASAVLISIDILLEDITITSINETWKISVIGTYDDNSTSDLTKGVSGTTYQSSDTTVAIIDTDGLITAVADGMATITATNKGLSDSMVVIVSIMPPDLNYIEVSPNNAILESIGQTIQLTITGTYSDGGTADLTSNTTGTTYQSSDTAVATVNADGIVTAVADGMTTITATNSGQSSSILLTVSTTCNAIGSFEVRPRKIIFTEIGSTKQLNVLGFFHSDHNLRDITSHTSGTTYISNNLSVVSVTNDGLIQAVSDGTAIITVDNTYLSSPQNTFNTVQVSVNTSITNQISFDINEDGGTIKIFNGLELNIPDGSLDQRTNITISKMALNPGLGPINNAALIGKYMYRFEPDNLSFNYPISISIPYSDNDIPAGSDENSLRIFVLRNNKWVLDIPYIDETTGYEEALGAQEVDGNNNRVIVSTRHFCYRALGSMGTSPQETTPAPASISSTEGFRINTINNLFTTTNRPPNITINQIVIHSTNSNNVVWNVIGDWIQLGRYVSPSGTLGAHFGAHFIIGQDGEIVQLADVNEKMLHAPGANNDGIGIELAHRIIRRPPYDLYTGAQLGSLVRLLNILLREYFPAHTFATINDLRSVIKTHKEVDKNQTTEYQFLILSRVYNPAQVGTPITLDITRDNNQVFYRWNSTTNSWVQVTNNPNTYTINTSVGRRYEVGVRGEGTVTVTTTIQNNTLSNSLTINRNTDYIVPPQNPPSQGGYTLYTAAQARKTDPSDKIIYNNDIQYPFHGNWDDPHPVELYMESTLESVLAYINDNDPGSIKGLIYAQGGDADHDSANLKEPGKGGDVNITSGFASKTWMQCEDNLIVPQGVSDGPCSGIKRFANVRISGDLHVTANTELYVNGVFHITQSGRIIVDPEGSTMGKVKIYTHGLALNNGIIDLHGRDYADGYALAMDGGNLEIHIQHRGTPLFIPTIITRGGDADESPSSACPTTPDGAKGGNIRIASISSDIIFAGRSMMDTTLIDHNLYWKKIPKPPLYTFYDFFSYSDSRLTPYFIRRGLFTSGGTGAHSNDRDCNYGKASKGGDGGLIWIKVYNYPVLSFRDISLCTGCGPEILANDLYLPFIYTSSTFYSFTGCLGGKGAYGGGLRGGNGGDGGKAGNIEFVGEYQMCPEPTNYTQSNSISVWNNTRNPNHYIGFAPDFGKMYIASSATNDLYSVYTIGGSGGFPGGSFGSFPGWFGANGQDGEIKGIGIQ